MSIEWVLRACTSQSATPSRHTPILLSSACHFGDWQLAVLGLAFHSLLAGSIEREDLLVSLLIALSISSFGEVIMAFSNGVIVGIALAGGTACKMVS